MPANKNFDIDPYFDDFDNTKGYHRVLFKPSVAVQARELTQLQTILQNQIETFGDNILTEGTIIKGCNFNYLNNLAYVKILDLQTDGQPVVLSNYVGARAVGLSTGVEAYILTTRTGLETQTPDLNTLYLRYVKSNGANKTFSTTENIRIENFDTATVIATVTAAGTVTGESVNAIGKGVGLKVSEGYIYQKGFFVYVEEQITVVEKYSTSPDGVAVGFTTVENIINSFSDTTLNDNAQGYPNESAPGADRFKLTPVLTVKTVSAANADETFFTLVEYQNGLPVRRKQNTQYSVIGQEFARRTSEESGNYVVRNFPLSIEAGSNSSFLKARIGAGLAYVDGNRVETFGPVDITIDAASEFASETSQNITTNIGHYVIGEEFMGNMKFNEIGSVELFDAPQEAFTGNSVVIPASANGTSIGTAKIRAVEHHSGTVGTNSCQYRFYLFDIRMSNSSVSFTDTKSIVFDGTNDGSTDLILENSKAVIKDFSFKKTFWEVGQKSLKTIPSANVDFVYRTVNESLTVSTGGTCAIALSGTDEWTYGASATLNSNQKLELVLICNETQTPYVKGQPIDLSGATVTTDVSGQTLTITGLSTPAATMDVIAYYNVKKISAAPAEKQSKTVYVKIQANTHPANTTGNYSLGLPDVYQLVGVYQSTNGTYSESETDVTSSFNLYPNMKDTYYDLSYVQKKKSLTIGADDVLLFKVKVFQENNTGSFDDGYFSVDSYTGIDLEDIPIYTSESGTIYDLRDVVDFRPYGSNTVAYSTTIGSANVANVLIGSSVSFSSGEKYIPAPNEAMEINYDYYLPRQDRLIVDEVGQFKIIKGVSSSRPIVPSPPAKGMSLATIYVPAFPSLTSLTANRANKPTYATKMSPESIRGYTMKDIGAIDRRLKQLEYYTVLSSLEQQTKDMAILDSNGLNRFKNGIFTDSFENFTVANVKSTEFNAGINPSYKELIPKFNQFDMDLQVANVTNVTNFGKAATLSKTDATLIDQPYATTARNAVTDFYKYTGVAFIHPQYDSGYDVTRAPDYNLDIDLTQPFVEFVENLNNFIPLQQVNRSVSRNTTFEPNLNVNGLNGTFATTQTTTTQTIRNLQATSGNEQFSQVGDFVTDIRFNPFMKEREVSIYVNGLRPNTRFHFFFDGQSVNSNVANATFITGGEEDYTTFRRNSVYGANLTSSDTGTLRAIFKIPANTFFVGDRKLEIMDVSSYSQKTNSVSYASITYSAFNYSVDKRFLNLTTRIPEIGTGLTTETNTTVTRAFIPTDNGNTEGDGDSDPIAQTFYVRSNMAKNDNVLFVSKLDLFFKTKSDTNGLSVYLKEVENGVITNRKVPLSTVHIPASNVNANTTAAQATTITFDAPIPLQVEQEYAFVIKPDGNDPDYQVWIAKTGGTDVLTNIAITQDVNDGVLFTSTNDRTWTPYQDENIKYKLYRANFSSSSGSIVLTNKESEFFSINSSSGTFNNDEYVFVNNAVVSAQTVSIAAGNTTVDGVSTTFSTYFSVGEHIVVAANSSTYDVLEIESITNNTHMILKDIPKYTNSTANFFKSIVGNVTLFDNNSPAKLYLDNSTADESTYFQANDVIVGAESGASCTIETVDNKKISYLAPNIYRINTTQTKTEMSATRLFRSDTSANYSKSEIKFNDYTFLNDNPTVVKSYSNEKADTDTDRSFALNVTLENTSGSTPRYSSPLIDVDIASIKAFEYVINDDNTNEDTTEGNAETKYISKVVSLADGLDAEDFKIFLTAYRPPSTNIDVYVKFKASTDPVSFDEKPWTLLEAKDSNGFSQNSNLYDYKEFEYNLPSSAPVSGAGFLNASNTFEYSDGVALYNSYKYFAIKLVLRSSTYYRVPKVYDFRSIALAA